MRRPRLLLAAASGGVLLSAADTYVIVIVLTAVMADVGLDVTQLQQAAPIISGFLLGYVVALPLLGRLSDLYGRRGIFLVCLGFFAAGSIVTASATTLATAVIGRTLQGLGGGGMVPITLALVADMWPPPRRSTPLGVVAGVQEFGSVAGPAYGAGILAFASWRLIFWINIPVSAVVGAIVFVAGRPTPTDAVRDGRRTDFVGWGLLVVTLVCLAAAVIAPSSLTTNDVVGLLYAPILPQSAWASFTTPVAIASVVGVMAFVLNEIFVSSQIRPVLNLRRIGELMRAADATGSALIALALACIVVTFAVGDPSRRVLSPAGYVLLPATVIFATAFAWVETHSTRPLIDFAVFRDRAAWGSMLTNFAVGVALIAALVDIPIFARTTAFPDSEVGAAFVLSRLLVAVPIGAVVGGRLCHWLGYRVVAGVGMGLCAAAFVAMTKWSSTVLTDSFAGISWLHPSDLSLVFCGLGFGLAIAPITAAMLSAVHAAFHGIASSLVVLSRVVGMLCGLSLLTAVGLHTFYVATAGITSPQITCPTSPLSCPPYETAIRNALVNELHTIFAGAAIAALIAAVLSATVLRARQVTA